MGIPYYFYKITNEHKNIITSTVPKCDRLFLDFNGIIHNVYNDIKNDVSNNIETHEFETILITKVIEYMVRICNFVSPKKMLYICIDGVAPFGKIKQQRSRRYLSNWLKSQIKPTGYQWDTNTISPGTNFMKELSSRLRSFIQTNQDEQKYEIILSDSDMRGEGEHKIFDYIFFHENKTSIDIIYGLDADLIMLSLICNKSNKYLLREPQHFNPRQKQEKQFLLLNINLLKSKLLTSFESEIDIQSYVFLCFLIGNDFLPCLSYLNIKNNGIDNIIAAYSRIPKGKQIISFNDKDRFEINFKVLCDLFEELNKDEDKNLKNIHDQYFRKKMIFHEHKTKIENYGVYKKNVSMMNIFENSNWRLQYYTKLFDKHQNNNSVITDACINYIEGLNWCVEYYFNKTIISNWQYNFDYSPTILDLYNICNVQKFEFKVNKVSNIDTGLQLLLILPISSIDVLPEHLQSIMKQFKYGHYYPSTFTIQTYLKTKLHECVPVLPKIHFQDLKIAYLNTIS